MSTEHASIIVAALAPSAEAAEVLRYAVDIRRANPGSELHLVHVVDLAPPPHDLPVPTTALLREGREFIDAMRDRIPPGNGEQTIAVVEVGPVTRTVLDYAERVSADLIVCGAHRRGPIASFFLGSTSQGLVRHARCPVFVAREKSYPPAPAIEPPCADCLRARQSSNGAEYWCAGHRAHRPRAHVYSDEPMPSSIGSGLPPLA